MTTKVLFKLEFHFKFHFRISDLIYWIKRLWRMRQICISAPKRTQTSSKVKVAIQVKKR